MPGSDTGCTFGEYIRKKSQKSSILQEDSCGNTALNKEKRNFRKKIQFVPPFSHSKRGTKRRFSHICSFETCKYTDSVKFRRKWITKSKKSHIVPHYLEQPFQDKYDSTNCSVLCTSTILPNICISWDIHPTFMLISGRVQRSFTHS